jgi:hypothetical protein
MLNTACPNDFYSGFLGGAGGALGGIGGALGGTIPPGAGGALGASPDAPADTVYPQFEHFTLVTGFFSPHLGQSASGTNPQFGQTARGSFIVSHWGQGSFPGSNFAPQFTQTVAMGLLIFPHL